MVMVRRLIGGYAGEVAEMEWNAAINAQRSGAVEILERLPNEVPILSDPRAPKIEIIDDRGKPRPSIDPVDEPGSPAAPLPRVELMDTQRRPGPRK
jgi:hypothetical protein